MICDGIARKLHRRRFHCSVSGVVDDCTYVVSLSGRGTLV